FANEYIIEERLAEGGMGEVYAATHERTRRRCALKVMRSGLVHDPALRARFEQEAMVGSVIDSEHKVDVFAAGVDAATDIPWLARELLDGEPLTAYLRRHGPLPLAEAESVLEQLLHCLASAHAAGVVHRDIKPDNIFVAHTRRIGASSMIKVLDFGIAK